MLIIMLKIETRTSLSFYEACFFLLLERENKLIVFKYSAELP